MSCLTKDQISDGLSSLPTAWRDQIADILFDIIKDKDCVSCDDVKDCETVTSLSDFSIDGTELSITYKDEGSVQYDRTFDFAQIINNSLDEVDPKCVATDEDWANMTFTERIQAIIDTHEDCCC